MHNLEIYEAKKTPYLNCDLSVYGDADCRCKVQRSAGILEVFADILRTEQTANERQCCDKQLNKTRQF